MKIISIAGVTEEALDILCVTFEGTDEVCESRLELFTSKIKNLRMSEEETINNFNGKRCYLANESFSLGAFKKALRSLPSRFVYKATTIRDIKDLKRKRLEELMGSLQTFEIELSEESKERKNLMGLRVKSELPTAKGSEFSKSMALLSNNFERAQKRLNTQVTSNSLTRKFSFGTFNPTNEGRTLRHSWVES